MRTLMLSLAAILSCLIAQASSPPDTLKNVHTIVCLGDSITEQGEAKGGYVWLIRQYLTALFPDQKINVINAGVAGHTSKEMLARLKKNVLAKKPDLVTVSVGINDVWNEFQDSHLKGDRARGVSLTDFTHNVDEIVTKIMKSGSRIMVLSTTVISEDPKAIENKKLVDYNRALRQIAKKHSVIFVDLQKSFHKAINLYHDNSPAHTKVLTIDGVHLNPAGNRIMAKSILNAMGVTPAMRLPVMKGIE